jgi:hypothetical protein
MVRRAQTFFASQQLSVVIVDRPSSIGGAASGSSMALVTIIMAIAMLLVGVAVYFLITAGY